MRPLDQGHFLGAEVDLRMELIFHVLLLRLDSEPLQALILLYLKLVDPFMQRGLAAKLVLVHHLCLCTVSRGSRPLD